MTYIYVYTAFCCRYVESYTHVDVTRADVIQVLRISNVAKAMWFLSTTSPLTRISISYDEGTKQDFGTFMPTEI